MASPFGACRRPPCKGGRGPDRRTIAGTKTSRSSRAGAGAAPHVEGSAIGGGDAYTLLLGERPANRLMPPVPPRIPLRRPRSPIPPCRFSGVLIHPALRTAAVADQVLRETVDPPRLIQAPPAHPTQRRRLHDHHPDRWSSYGPAWPTHARRASAQRKEQSLSADNPVTPRCTRCRWRTATSRSCRCPRRSTPCGGELDPVSRTACHEAGSSSLRQGGPSEAASQ